MGLDPDDRGLTRDDVKRLAVPVEVPPDPEAAADAERRAELDACRVGLFMGAELARLHARAQGKETPIRLPWPGVNRELGGGIWPGCYVLVGNTGSGKSQWALQLALHAALDGVPVLYVGLELGRLDLVARLVGLVSGRKWSRLYLGSRAELGAVEAEHAEKLGELSRAPFHLVTASSHGWDYRQLDAAALGMRSLYPEDRPGDRPLLIVLDFLQLVSSPADAREDLRERIGRAAYAGRSVAREHGAAVLLLSSTAREHYNTLAGEPPKRGKGPATPTPSPLGKGNPARLVGLGKESGDVEYAADGALVLAAEPWGADEPPAEGTTCWLAVAKIRARPEDATGWAELRFDGGQFTPPPQRVAVPRRGEG